MKRFFLFSLLALSFMVTVTTQRVFAFPAPPTGPVCAGTTAPCILPKICCPILNGPSGEYCTNAPCPNPPPPPTPTPVSCSTECTNSGYNGGYRFSSSDLLHTCDPPHIVHPTYNNCCCVPSTNPTPPPPCAGNTTTTKPCYSNDSTIIICCLPTDSCYRPPASGGVLCAPPSPTPTP